MGWNIVTSYLESAASFFGQSSLTEYDTCYAQAEEFLTLCYKFWEG